MVDTTLALLYGGVHGQTSACVLAVIKPSLAFVRKEMVHLYYEFVNLSGRHN